MDVSMKQNHDPKKLRRPTSEESFRKQRIEKLNEQLREHPELLAAAFPYPVICITLSLMLIRGMRDTLGLEIFDVATPIHSFVEK